MNECRCQSRWYWCWLDWVFRCRVPYICQAHDRAITKALE